MKAFCIGTPEAVKGFALIGVDGVSPADEAGTSAALDRAFGEPEIGLVIITERLAAPVHERLSEWTFANRRPLIIEVPDETGPAEGHARVLSLVMESVGLERPS